MIELIRGIVWMKYSPISDGKVLSEKWRKKRWRTDYDESLITGFSQYTKTVTKVVHRVLISLFKVYKVWNTSQWVCKTTYLLNSRITPLTGITRKSKRNKMNNHYWVKEMEKWVNNMTPKEKLEFDKGVEEMKTEMFINVVKKVIEKKWTTK